MLKAGLAVKGMRKGNWFSMKAKAKVELPVVVEAKVEVEAEAEALPVPALSAEAPNILKKKKMEKTLLNHPQHNKEPKSKLATFLNT